MNVLFLILRRRKEFFREQSVGTGRRLNTESVGKDGGGGLGRHCFLMHARPQTRAVDEQRHVGVVGMRRAMRRPGDEWERKEVVGL